ncbi:Transcriptional repressor NF-X1 [Mortierella claussenii]|nr:Transcriptional repressor NF-X1 [Mortierella claussenii]
MTDLFTVTSATVPATFTPHFVNSTGSTADTLDNSSRPNSDARSRNRRATKQPRSTPARIDDDGNNDQATASQPRAQAHGDGRRRDKGVDQPSMIESAIVESTSSNQNDTKSSGSSNSSCRRQRRQQKDISSRVFASSAQHALSSSPAELARHQKKTVDSAPHAHSPNSLALRNQNTQRHQHQKRSILRPTTAAIAAKHAHKVEEDRNLMEALTVGLTQSTYDCMVCWDVIRPAHKIWNCQVCYAAFHLDCLSTWAKKSSGETNNNGTGWRCPGCQNTQVSLPKDYTCFCRKVSNPEYNRYFTPHSFHVIQVHALHVVVLAQSSRVIVETRRSNCVVWILISLSRLADLVSKYAERYWDVESTHVLLSAMLDSVRLVRKQRSKYVTVESISAKRAVVKES